MKENFKFGITGRVEQDVYPFDPRTGWDNLGVMFCKHDHYNLGDPKAEPPPKDSISLPVYLYDHSGLTVSTSPFSCPWDSGQVGWIYVTKEKLRAEFGWNRITKARREKAQAYLEGEVRTYDQYLTGDVWGYTIEDAAGNTLDSCWGFYGEEYCEQEMRSMVAYYEAEFEEEVAAQTIEEVGQCST